MDDAIDRRAWRRYDSGFTWAWIAISFALWLVPGVPAEVVAAVAALSHIYLARALALTYRSPSGESGSASR